MCLEVDSLAKLLAVTLTFLSTFAFSAYAVPLLFDPFPENNSYTKYVEKQLFHINITEYDLNTSNVTLYIVSLDYYQQGGEWDSYKMSCSGSPPSWFCSYNKSLVIVGSDTVELFYFEASDDNGLTGYSGNATDPWVFTVDILPPDINFLNPTNGSYVSGTEDIILKISDISAGVDSNTVKYSFDNSTWFDTTSNKYFEAEWDTTGLENNKTVTIYARANDTVGNEGRKSMNVTVDNEVPYVVITEPKENQMLTGTVPFGLNASDTFSGVNSSQIKFKIGTFESGMGCFGTIHNYSCSAYFDTTYLADGTYTINFSVMDLASNLNSQTRQVTVDNSLLSVWITKPENNGYVSGLTIINASLLNAYKAGGAKIKINEIWYEMNCTASTCAYSWNTTTLEDGLKNLFINVTNNMSYLVNTTIYVTVDNTAPQLIIDSPVEGEVNGTIYPKLIVTDNYGVDAENTFFNISNVTYAMACSKQEGGKKYVCGGNFNTTDLVDGDYKLYFHSKDLAGNKNTTSVRLYVKNGIETVTTTVPSMGEGVTTTVVEIEEGEEKIFDLTKVSPTTFVIIGSLVGVIGFFIWLLRKIILEQKEDVWKKLKEKWSGEHYELC